MATIQAEGKQRGAQPLNAAEFPDALLKIATVQALTGLGRTTLYAKTSAGEFPRPVRLGARCTRWRASDVQAWLRLQQPK